MSNGRAATKATTLFGAFRMHHPTPRTATISTPSALIFTCLENKWHSFFFLLAEWFVSLFYIFYSHIAFGWPDRIRGKINKKTFFSFRFFENFFFTFGPPTLLQETIQMLVPYI